MPHIKCDVASCESDGKVRPMVDTETAHKRNIYLCDKHDQLLQDHEKIALARIKASGN